MNDLYCQSTGTGTGKSKFGRKFGFHETHNDRTNDTPNDSCHSIQSRAAIKPGGVKPTQLMSRETLQGSVGTLVSLYLQPCCRLNGGAYSQGGEEAGGGGGGAV